MKQKVAILASGTGSLFEALVQHSLTSKNFEVVLLVSDQKSSGVIEKSMNLNIKNIVIDPKSYPDKDLWTKDLIKVLTEHKVDWIFCLGFMRILDNNIISSFKNRIINSHPALLPNFPGAQAVQDALAAGVTQTGATVHLIDEGIDTGPIILQKTVEIRPGDTKDSLHERIKEVEKKLICDAMDRLSQNKFAVVNGKVEFNS